MIVQDADLYQELTFREGEAPFLMSRVTDRDFDAILKADITSIAITIKNTSTLEIVKDGTALSKATVWFDTYQTDEGWTTDFDATGYNFGYQTDADDFVTTGDDATFKVEVLVTPASGEPFYAGWWKCNVIHSISTVNEPA